MQHFFRAIHTEPFHGRGLPQRFRNPTIAAAHFKNAITGVRREKLQRDVSVALRFEMPTRIARCPPGLPEVGRPLITIGGACFLDIHQLEIPKEWYTVPAEESEQGAYLPQDFIYAVGEILESKIPQKAFAAALTHFAPQCFISQQFDEDGRELVVVALANQESVHAVFDDVWDSAMRTSHHRFAERHRFQKHQAETFSAAGQRENVAAVIPRDKVRALQGIQERDGSSAGNDRGLLFQSWRSSPSPMATSIASGIAARIRGIASINSSRPL